MDNTDFTPAQPVDFSYGAGSGAGDLPRHGPAVALTILADRPHVRASMREDAVAAGLRVTAASLGDMRDDGGPLLGDVVSVDCPVANAETLAALARLDLQACRSGVRLIVSTSVDALDDVFACMDHSDPVLLVDPTRAERVVALGRVLAAMPQGRVRELSDDDRLMILRLTEQVGEIAGRIERLSPKNGVEAGLQVRSHASRSPAAVPTPAIPLAPVSKSTGLLPEARLLRRILRQRQLRARFIEGDLFADPAWDMLLDLAAARVEGKQVSVTSLCIAAAVPPTTALRWIGQMVEGGLFRRVLDYSDRRRAYFCPQPRTFCRISRR